MPASSKRPRRPAEDVLAPLVGLARRAGDFATSEREHAAGKARLFAALAKNRGKLRWLAVPLLCAAAAAAVALLVGHRARLTVVVQGARLADNGSLAASLSPAFARFSDGTELELFAASSARIAEIDADGARISLEQGALRLSVRHRPKARWSVEAGPYSVRVTGTELEVSWSPRERALQVGVTRGSVEVKGPLAPAGLAVRAGQALSASETGLRVAETAALPTATATASPAPLAPSAASPPSPAPEPAGQASKAAAPSWSARVAAGDFAGVLAEADARGIDAVLATGSVDELSALADAARYGRRGELAKRALQAQRRRFPGTAAAHTAAFLLARMADDAGAGVEARVEAISLYGQYLSEGGGPLAAEALGRKMIAESRAGRDADARASAERYLDAFPAGAHAAAARALLGRSQRAAPERR